MVVKLALAVVVPGVDVVALVQCQRSAAQQFLHDLTRTRRGLSSDDLTGRLVLDNHIFTTEAELRWLDSVEGSVARLAGRLAESAGQTTASASRAPVALDPAGAVALVRRAR